MAEQRHGEHHLSGRLLAALWTIRLLAGETGRPPRQEDLLVKEKPSDFLETAMASLLDHLMAAKRRGGEHWKAAAEVYGAIPGLLPLRQVPGHTMGPGPQRAFADGYAQQRAAHAEKYGRLVEG